MYVQKNQVQIHIFSRFSLSDRSWGKKDWLKNRDFTCLWDIAQIVYIMYDGLTNMRRSSKIRVKNVLKISILCKYISPVWKIQKMVKNPCLSVKNMRIWCEKFQKKFGLNWRFPWGAIAKTCSLAFCSAICPLHVIYKAICGPKKIHPVCLTFEPLRLQMTTIA